MAKSKVDSESVFLNVPFDRGYESLFVTLVGTLIFLGQKPRCVLEVRETGDGRLRRIFDLRRSAATLRRTTAIIKRRLRAKTVFRPSAFRAIGEAATEIAVEAGYIAP